MNAECFGTPVIHHSSFIIQNSLPAIQAAASPARRSPATLPCVRGSGRFRRECRGFALRSRTTGINARASSGGAASMKLGRRPLRQSPSSVNWLTTNIAPPASASERFIFPASSSNTRSSTIFCAICLASSSLSPTATPNSTKRPRFDLADRFAGDRHCGAADTLDDRHAWGI